MNSLSMHLRAGESHDSLPFNHSCPICRDTRLHGDLVVAPIVTLRTQAAVVAGVVALSGSAIPAAAVAAEADTTEDGTATVTQTAPADPAASVEYDPGGPAAALPDPAPTPAPAQAPAAPAADTSSDNAGDAPAGDEDDPVVDPGDEKQVAPAAVPLTPAASVVTPAAPPTPASELAAPAQADAVPASPPVPSVAPAPAPAVVAAPTAPRSAPRQVKQSRKRTRAERRPTTTAVVPTVVRKAAAPRPAVPVAAPATSSLVGTAAVSTTGTAHTVRPGESLWAIASDLLGPNASPAKIAREVHRLWTMNADRIATGDPDLLIVGTRLRLR